MFLGVIVNHQVDLYKASNLTPAGPQAYLLQSLQFVNHTLGDGFT